MRRIIMAVAISGLIWGCGEREQQKANNNETVSTEEVRTDTVVAKQGALDGYMHSLAHVDRKYMLDTSRSFPNFMSMIVYKREKDTLLKHLRRDNVYSKEDRENLGLLNSTGFYYLFHKYLKESGDRSDTVFNVMALLIGVKGMFPKEDLLGILNEFPEKKRNSETGKKFYRLLNPKNNIGQSLLGAGKFMVNDPQGNKLDIQTLIDGKYDHYVLVMTASWCMPCHLSYTKHKKGFDALKGKNIRLISLSVDNNQAAWKKMIAKEGYVKECYLDVDGSKSKLMGFFEYESIPRYILLDREGKVIADYDGVTVEQLFDKLHIDWKEKTG